MPREIISEKDCEQARRGAVSMDKPFPVTDDYLDRFVKYIPEETIMVYVFTLGLIEYVTKDGTLEEEILLWVMYGLLQILTPIAFYLEGVRKWQQFVIATISFALWAAAYGGPFDLIKGFDRMYVSTLLPIYSLAVALFKI
eukprot:scaffold81970_cov51-Attheya_sp.AAC.1